jgi:hypothetical protein
MCTDLYVLYIYHIHDAWCMPQAYKPQLDNFILMAYLRVCMLNKVECNNNSDAIHFAVFQRLGDPLQMSQSIVIYNFYAMNVFVFCWFGSELTRQESIQKQKNVLI